MRVFALLRPDFKVAVPPIAIRETRSSFRSRQIRAQKSVTRNVRAFLVWGSIIFCSMTR